MTKTTANLSKARRRALSSIKRLKARAEKVEARYKRNQAKVGLVTLRRSPYGPSFYGMRRKLETLQNGLISGRLPLATCVLVCRFGRLHLELMELVNRYGTPTGKDGAKVLTLD
jgi:hypothetical protein